MTKTKLQMDAVIAVVACDCLSLKARMADRMITRAYDEALRPTGLRVTQFSLLTAISYGAPESISELANWLAMERTTLTRNLKLLEKDGLITSRAGVHHRSRASELTVQGKLKLKQAYPLWQAVQAEFRDRLGDEGWQESTVALARLAAIKN